MIEGLDLTWTDLGASGLLVLTVLLIFTGRLVPKRYYDEALARLAKADEDNKHLKKAAESLLEQNSELLTNADLSLALMQSIKSYAALGKGDGDAP